MFVWLCYSQTLAAVIAGGEAAWEIVGGVFALLIHDNLKPVIAAADAVNPQFTRGWFDYAGHGGFVTDPLRPLDATETSDIYEIVVERLRAGSSCMADHDRRHATGPISHRPTDHHRPHPGHRRTVLPPTHPRRPA